MSVEPRGAGVHRVAERGWSLFSSPAPTAAAVASSKPPIVGRRRERHLLEDAAAAAVAGQPSLVLVTGDAGMGSSRLLDELGGVADAAGALVLRSRGWPDHDEAYVTLRRGADELSDRDPRRDTGGPAFPEGAPDLAEVERWLDALVATAPLLVVVDDLHLADAATAALVVHLADRVAADECRRRLLVAASAPPGDPVAEALLLTGGATHVPLRPLDRAEAVELALAVVGPDRSRADELAEAADGNPLLIIAMARQASARGTGAAGAGRPGGHHAVAVASAADTPLRGGFAAVFAAQIDGLDEEARSVAAAVAVCGAVAEVDRLARLTWLAPGDLDAAVERCRVAGVLDRPPIGRTVGFTHPVLRQAAYTSVPTIGRKLLHLRVAEDLGSGARPLVPERLMAAAHHLRRAGFVAPAPLVIEICGAAAAHAAETKVWRAAAANCDAVLSVVEPGTAEAARWTLEAARSHLHDLHLERAAVLAVSAHEQHEALGDRDGAADALAVQHRCEIMSGRVGRRLADGARPTVGDAADRAAIRATVDLSERRWMAGDLGDAADLADAAERQARLLGADDLVRAAVVSRSTCDWLRFELTTAHDRLRAVLPDDVLVAPPPDVSTAAGRAALTAWWLGDVDAARRLAAVAREVAEVAAEPVEAIIPLAALAAQRLAEGDLRDGERLVAEALTLQRTSHDHWASAFLYPVSATCLLVSGRGREASQLLNLWRAEIEERGGGHELRLAELSLRWARAWRGLTTAGDREAFAADREIVEIIAAEGTPLVVGVDCFLSLYGDAADLLGDADLARAVEVGLRRCAERGAQVVSGTGGLVARQRAACARVAGDRSLAADLLDAAAELAHRHALGGESTRIEVERARLAGGVDLDAALDRARDRGFVGLADRLATEPIP